MSLTAIAIFSIALPIILIALIIILLTKNKVYALRGIALYLLVYGGFLLSKDWMTSIALIVSGIVIILGAYSTNLSTKISKILLILSFSILVFVLLIYSYVSLKGMTANITYEYLDGCNINKSSTDIQPYYGSCNIKIEYEIKAPVPINQQPKVMLCVEGKEMYGYYDKKTKTLKIYNYIEIEKIENKEICLTYKDSCDECVGKTKLE